MRKLLGLVAPILVLGAAGAADAQVRINEILPNPGSDHDGAEFIELYNAGGASVNLAGWVLTGTEFNGTCGGEEHWQFPAGASIPAGGYIVVAKDNSDIAPEPDDGFRQRFGFNADFEMYDSDRTYEYDDPAVPNLNLLTPDGFDNQIGLIPGSGYGATCVAFNQYDALYLYNGTPGAGGVVQDVIEWRDPVACPSDVCLGVGSSDNDAFAILPGTGESICRNATSTDTNNSAADLFLGTNTPKAANIANAGPLLSNMTLSNPGPKAGQSVNVSITATDTDGIGTGYVVYRVNGGAPDSSAMSLSGPNQYTGTIPTQLDGDNVTYFVRMYDAGNAAGVGRSKYPDYGTRSIRWGTQTIFSIQFHSPASDTGQSVEVGKAVNVEGIVTTETGLYNAGTFTLQSGTGFWSGVKCFDPTATVSVQRGDSVRVSGTVEENFDETEVVLFGPTQVQVLSSGNALPAPFSATCSQITTGSPFGELLEGVYTRLDDLLVTNPDDGFGQWTVTDASGSALIGDDAFYLYSPTLGDSIVAVEGVTAWSFSERKLEPRDGSDIIGPPIISTLRYAPIPPTSSAPINFSALITDNGTITRAKLYYSTNNGATYDSTNLVHGGGDLWSVNLGPFANGTDVDYHVEVTDDTGFPAREPALGDFDLYVGTVTIQTVQSTVTAGTDASVFVNQPRNLSGIVTQAPGTIADNIFVIQNHWTTTPAYRGIHVFSGGSLVGQVAVGDSVTVCGDVTEYFGLTELRMHFTDAYTNHGHVGSLPGYELVTTDFPPDSTGALPPAEQWEGVLIQMPGAVVTNAAAGFGQFFIDNTAPFTGQETLVDDEARISGFSYAPVLGDSVTVRGIGDFTFGEYKIAPRNDTDILPFDPADAVGVDDLPVDLSFALGQSVPNPVHEGLARITFALPNGGEARLRVFDVRGRLVRTLVNGEMPAGRHTVAWDGHNDDDRQVASGVYFYRLQAGDKEMTRKMLVVR
ncbi:MAG: lamin tail domain-containing protein [Gemmatimonadetes bacterium]|nr:lamin tail domain-containing protein [Gemmatimonadota bacterium]